jgi:hypothetical protein
VLDRLPPALHQEVVVQRGRRRDRLGPAGWRERESSQVALPGLQPGAGNFARGVYLLVREGVGPHIVARAPSVFLRTDLFASPILPSPLLGYVPCGALSTLCANGPHPDLLLRSRNENETLRRHRLRQWMELRSGLQRANGMWEALLWTALPRRLVRFMRGSRRSSLLLWPAHGGYSMQSPRRREEQRADRDPGRWITKIRRMDGPVQLRPALQ